MLLTLAVGFLMDGPVDSIQTNLETLTDSFVCMYNQAKQLACDMRKTQIQQVDDVSFFINIFYSWISRLGLIFSIFSHYI